MGIIIVSPIIPCSDGHYVVFNRTTELTVVEGIILAHSKSLDCLCLVYDMDGNSYYRIQMAKRYQENWRYTCIHRRQSVGRFAEIACHFVISQGSVFIDVTYGLFWYTHINANMSYIYGNQHKDFYVICIYFCYSILSFLNMLGMRETGG